MIYKWSMSGTAAQGQTWATEGTLEKSAGEFSTLLFDAMAETFQRLTQGKAVFGQPGVGCRGPYAVKRFTVEEQG